MKFKVLAVITLFLSMNSSVFTQHSVDAEQLIGIKRPKIGLVLSGGGAKGLAHIGVLKVLEECGVKPDYITGTSMGSIVGGLYALGYSASEIEEFVNNADWTTLLSDKFTWRDVGIFRKDQYPGYPLKFIFNKGQKPSLPSGMIQGQQIHSLLLMLCWSSIQYESFDDFPIPFRCVATDIMTGQAIVFKEGNLADAMRTSMSIPTVFSPVIIDSLLLADGGMVRNFPVQECIDMGADIVIGSYTGFNEKAKAEDMRSMVSILTRSSVFQGINDAKVQIPKTDIFIVPDLTDYSAESFSKASQIMKAGELAARDSLLYLKLQEVGLIDKFWPQSIKNDSLGDIIIDQIIISGPPSADIHLIEETCNIYPGGKVNQFSLQKAIEKLYAAGDYKKVSYQILQKNDKNTLVFKCVENEAGTIELGLHYNNSFGPALLARYTMRDFLIPSSLFKAKFSFSENPRLELNYDYYLTKRKNFAVFAEGYLQANKMPNVLWNNDTIMILGHYRYNHFNYSLGAKLQLWKNGMIEAKVGQNYNALKMKDGMQYLFEMEELNYMDNFAQVSFKVNNFDDPYFPTKGLYFNFSYKWLFKAQMSKHIEPLYLQGLSSRNEMARLDYKQYIRFKKRFSLTTELCIGLMDSKSFLTEEFFIGGHNYQIRSNAVNMSGIKANNIVADNFVKVGISAQLKLFDRWYIQHGQEALGFIDSQQIYSEDEILSGQIITGWYTGVGVSTRVGPLRLICSGSYERKGLSWSLNLGIPF